jgi:hypothetical protein
MDDLHIVVLWFMPRNLVDTHKSLEENACFIFRVYRDYSRVQTAISASPLTSTSIPMMEAVCSSKTPVYSQVTSWWSNPKDYI